MTDQMDVDVPTSSSLESLSASSSFEKLDLASLNDSMKQYCCDLLWEKHITPLDDSRWLLAFCQPHDDIGGHKREK